MARRLEPLLEEPLGFVAPAEPVLARVRFELAAGRRLELVWRTLVLPETPEGDERLAARVRFAFGRALRLARREAASPVTARPRPRRSTTSASPRPQRATASRCRSARSCCATAWRSFRTCG